MGRSSRELRLRRHARVRFKVAGTAERPRVAVSRSNRHISAQAIDDVAGRTLVAASSTEASFNDDSASGRALATKVGELLAQRATSQGISTVVFDRGGFAYHGRVAALADAMRAGGVSF